MEPKRAVVEIGLVCTCATEIRAAGEVPSVRSAPQARPDGPRAGVEHPYLALAALRSPLSFLVFASTAPLRVCRRSTARDRYRACKCRRDEGCRQYIPGAHMLPVRLANDERY